MCGIYIHIPYCKTRCTYCDFYTQTNLLDVDDYVDCICKELYLQRSFFDKSEKVETIYFGGGTPSVLKIRHLDAIFKALFQNFNVALTEVTFEANPDDINSEYLNELKHTPINRFSLGVQTFNDSQLLAINRRHSSNKALESIKNIQDKGYSNISIDLIYGLPQQTLDQWDTNIETTIQLDIPHISAYHLIYEPNTKLYLDRKKGLVEEVTEELSVEMYELLVKTLTNDEYEHYEISNFAKNQLYSKHNSSYWLDKKYLGVGVAAHSYNGVDRFYNPPSQTKYMKVLKENSLFYEIEKLNTSEKYNEFVFTRLRTMWGVNRLELIKKFDVKYVNYFDLMIAKYIKLGSVTSIEDQIIISDQNMLISDQIMSDLMFLD